MYMPAPPELPSILASLPPASAGIGPILDSLVTPFYNAFQPIVHQEFTSWIPAIPAVFTVLLVRRWVWRFLMLAVFGRRGWYYERPW